MFEKIGNKMSNYQNIVEQIKSMIISGELNLGDKLPPERELAESFGVSRASIREAIKALEVIGIVESRQGEGNFIVNNLNQTTSDNILLIYALNKGTIKDIFQLRKCIEMESVINIIKKCTDSEINELKQIMDKFNSAPDAETRSYYHIQFHSKIILLSGNVLFTYLVDALSSLISSNIKTVSNIIYRRYPEDEVYRNHNDIMHAIETRDLAAADAAMAIHYSFTKQEEEIFENLQY